MELFVFFIFWALLAWGVAALANSRGRSGVGFFLLSFLLSPLLGLIVVLIMSNLTEEDARATQRKIEAEAIEKIRSQEHERQLESIKAIAVPQQKHLASAAMPSSTIGSVADEIRKLGQLRTEGLLTDAEFQSQKSLLLGHAQQQDTTLQVQTPSKAKEPELKVIDRLGICPNCKANIPLSSKKCSECTANFQEGSIWVVKPI